jgi:hypothetical protein
MIGCLPWSWHRCLCDGEEHSENCQPFQHNSEIVPSRNLDTIWIRSNHNL